LIINILNDNKMKKQIKMDIFREVVTKDTVESINIRGLILNSIDNALIPHNVRLNMFDHDIEDMKKDILKQLLTKI
tara:strand:- start:1015 stop:1242 length:228 start_codon:yes stop_codon:yes gene_type:complete